MRSVKKTNGELNKINVLIWLYHRSQNSFGDLCVFEKKEGGNVTLVRYNRGGKFWNFTTPVKKKYLWKTLLLLEMGQCTPLLLL